ncbi:hypothetical protein R1flu_015470 [Riccia fluitans]|uniref:LITAF domain-containing protein n=1 Tax=Riccia fluitans TaxID=41844 RepID=A0ABD1YJ24_9MARC
MAGSYQTDGEAKNTGGQYSEPVMGIPYGYPPQGQSAYGYPPPPQGSAPYGYGQQASQPMYQQQPVMQAPPQQSVYYQPVSTAHLAGMIPVNALYGPPPTGVSIRETFFADTPAPIECPNCGRTGMTEVKSKPSLAACVACAMSIVGVCFLFKSCDCLWHKEHYCHNCGEKVAEVKKDPCLCVDPPSWQQQSFAIPS